MKLFKSSEVLKSMAKIHLLKLLNITAITDTLNINECVPNK